MAASVGCAIGLLTPALVGAVDSGRAPEPGGDDLIGVTTGRQAELRETVAITRRRGAGEQAVLSLALPTLKRDDRVRFNGEVTVTTTCVVRDRRCIGRRYRFDPRLRARIVLAGASRAAGPNTLPVSDRVGVTCEQNRPNRNHHCPLVIRDGIPIQRPGRLPCRPAACRLNMVLGAHHPRAEGGEVVVVGADQPDGTVEGGKGRLGAAVARAGGSVGGVVMRTARRRARRLPASFAGGQRVVYSQRLGDLAAGDVLLVRARQRTRIRELPYFVAAKVVIATRPNARVPGPLTRRIVTRRGTATETNGFNCTVGPSAFRSPCLTKKAGLAVIKRAPKDRRGRERPLYVNLVSRTFPKLAQARRGEYAPARILSGGRLVVTRLRERQIRTKPR